jgi:predicted NUDIX family NTP pyrophosphohydrolase
VQVEVVRAAGGVVERAVADRSGDAEILIVHRPRYDDWTLPKGKAKRGESDEACALREVEEETGLAWELGEEVALGGYEVAGRPKSVRYFDMNSGAPYRRARSAGRSPWPSVFLSREVSPRIELGCEGVITRSGEPGSDPCRSGRDSNGRGQTLAVRDVTRTAGVRPLPFGT